PLVCARGHGADGGDDTDAPVAAGGQERPHTGVDDADDGGVVLEAQGVEGGGRRVVAGDDHHLHVVAGDEEVGDLAGEIAHLFERPGTVGIAPRVAEVDDVLVGQEVDQGP